MNRTDTSMIRDMISVGVGGFQDITPYDSDDERPVDYEFGLPMWGTMWSFGDSIDDYWLLGDDEIGAKDHLKEMYECGFNIWDSEYGVFFGIDGAGYDFYESHWIPLYDARGLQWHK